MTVWDSWNSGTAPFYPHAKAVQFALRSVPRDRRAGARALDLGCGSGNNTWFLAREGFDVTATDISPNGIAATRARLAADGLRADLRIEDACALSAPDARFDLVICIGVLEAIGPQNAPLAVAQIARTLAPGGHAIAVLMADDDFRTRLTLPFALHGFDKAQINGLAALLPGARIGRYVTDYDDGAPPQADWILTAKAPP